MTADAAILPKDLVDEASRVLLANKVRCPKGASQDVLHQKCSRPAFCASLRPAARALLCRVFGALP